MTALDLESLQVEVAASHQVAAGERKLLSALLLDAIAIVSGRVIVSRLQLERTRVWFRSTRKTAAPWREGVSFEATCQFLGLSPSEIRRVALGEGVADPGQMYRPKVYRAHAGSRA